MKSMHKTSGEKDRNLFSMAYTTFIVLLIFTFVVSCLYIGVNSYLSR